MSRKLVFAVLGGLLFFVIQPAIVLAMDEVADMGLFFDQEELVETTSGYPKPISQVAENVTIITAAEIDRLHAHSMGQVLQEISGLFVLPFGQDFNSSFLLLSQGAEAERTLVLIDGVRYNNASAGIALLNGLPVDIIKRIEVIKGPVSSVWGSSLGGVINILTKDAGSTERPTGRLTASMGEADSLDVKGDLSGKIRSLGYYLYGGHQESDGLWEERYFDNTPFYGKLKFDLPGEMTLGVTTGYSDADYKILEWAAEDRQEWQTNRNLFSTAYFDAPLKNGLALHLAASYFAQDFYWEFDGMGLGGWGPGVGDGDFLWSYDYSEHSTTISGRLSWQGKQHSALLGFEQTKSEMDYTQDWGNWGGRTPYPRVSEERRGIFANAAFNWGRLSLSPGLRYDYNSNSDDFFSPSLGVTFQLFDTTLLRGAIARGFNAPYLSQLFGSGGNPDLLPEEVVSYQVGIESTALNDVRLSVLAFLHQVDELWLPSQDSASGLWDNSGSVNRRGVDVEAATAPWHHFSVSTKASFVSYGDYDNVDMGSMSATNVVLLYENPSVMTARLGGRYIWWNAEYDIDFPRHDTFIWDLSLSRQVYSSPQLTAEVFGVARNLFEGSQYWDIDYQNAGRWLEGGLILRF